MRDMKTNTPPGLNNKHIKTLPKCAVLCVLGVFSLFFSPTIGYADNGSGKVITPVVNRAYLENCLEIIKRSKNSLSISEFYFKEDITTSKIKEAIADAAKRNVRVRILLDSSVPENSSAVKVFSELGAEAKLYDPKSKLHAKMIITDGSSVLLGSTNFSAKSIEENNETNVLINDPGVSKTFQNYFEKLWASKDISGNPAFDGIDPKAKVLPVIGRNYLGRALNLINNSKKEIGVILYMAHFTPKYYSSKPNILLRALCDARRNGVRVRVILEKSDYDKKLNEMNQTLIEYLSDNNIEIKFDSPQTITHAKLLLCDNEALLGSTNWVLSGLGKNKEADVLIRDDESVAEYWKYFEELWLKY